MKIARGEYKVAVNPQWFGAKDDNGIRKGHIANQLFGFYKRYGRYDVTHLPSGRVIGSIEGFANTKEYIEKLMQVPVDWKSSDPFRTTPTETRDVVRDLVREYEAA